VPLPAVAPVTPELKETVQVKVVLGKLAVKAIGVIAPPQTVWDKMELVMFGISFRI
jgi:hypothetical protein